MIATEGCREFRNQQLTRRDVLSIGGAGALGLTLPEFLAKRQAWADSSLPGFGRARAVIFLYLHGGHPQHDTFDPKPKAPAEIRGEFADIGTSMTGVRFSELFPRCAGLADRFSIVRSMSHDNANHVQASLSACTGHDHPRAFRSRGDFPPSATDFPPFGAVLDHLRSGQRALPNWVQLGPIMTRNNGTVLHGQLPGFLGDAHRALTVDEDFTADVIKVDAVTPRVGVDRLSGRQRLLRSIEKQRANLDTLWTDAGPRDVFYQRAFDLLTSSQTREAFDLARERESNRRRYPRNHVGQACLVARRLVEAGVPFVNVHWCKKPGASWDTHSQNFRKMKDSLGPTLDQALAALLEDLEDRGLLDEVLVMPMAEFGRTPTINKSAGRDHWPFVYTLAFAGGGARRGVVEGASDAMGAHPGTPPYSPADMAATIYHLLGIPMDTVLYDRERRPHQLMIGRPIEAVLG